MKIQNSIANIKEKDFGKLLENFLSLSSLQIASYIFPLITIPYLARVIGVERFGEIAFANAIIIYFQTLVDFGFNYTGTRDAAKNKNDNLKLSEIFSAIFWTKFVLIVLSFFLLIVLLLLINSLYSMRLLLIVSFCLVPCYAISSEWLFQGLEKMKYITVLNLIAKLLFTLLIFLFIKEEKDYILQPVFTAAGFLLSGLIGLYIIIKKFKIKLLNPSFAVIKRSLNEGVDVFINQLFPNLYNSFSILLLGFFEGAYATGIFDAAAKFFNIAQQLIVVISRSFFPYLSRNIKAHSYYSRLNLLISIAIAAFLFVFSPEIIKTFYTNDFIEAVGILRILSFSIFFIALISVYGTNFMIIQGYERFLRNITIKSSIIGFCMAWPLIYNYGLIGTAITIVITRGIFGIWITLKVWLIKRQISDMLINVKTIKN